MATLDEQIQLAERIAKDLTEVTRNEWMRWMQVASRKGIEYAVRYAQRLSTDMTMRPAIQRANRLIAQSVAKHGNVLKSLASREREAVLGYVGWWLSVKTLRGSPASREDRP